jgi:glycine cleavage system aminomethyltransferase T
VALFELSPFTKIRVHGPDALSLLQRLCCSELDVEQGRAIYTQMLNARGGIEADVTVTRLSEAEFLVISGAATRRRDLAWISRHVADRERLAVEDVTERHAVLGVFGSRSRALLQGVSGTDLSSTAFPFASSQMIEIASVPVRATRIGFVGELGWELMIPAGHALAVHAAIARADSDLGLSHAGHLCLEACRMEKGFRHWGHDLGPDDTPLEAGLGFTVAWHKRSPFLGRDGLLRQREQGPRRHLLLFAVADGNPLLLHDEPIYADGRLVGRTTSGARGFRTGLSLCFGYVSAQPGESRADLIGRDYEIGVAGRRHRLLAQRQPPYDPKGERMRS